MTLPTFIENFHFLRPLWLLAIIPAGLLSYYFWQQKSSSANWHGAINTNLLDHLIDSGSSKATRWPWIVLLLCWLLSALALAGPAWKKLPQPVLKNQDVLIIVLDLTLSMLAEDVKPSRHIRAQYKVLDVLKRREEGLTALIAYSGDAHVVSPLTDDSSTIENLATALSPEMMPVFGSNPAAALRQAQQLFDNAKINNGRILLITDGVTTDDVEDIDDDLRRNGFELSILGVGTPDGAPIPATQGFLKDNQGKIVVPQLKRAPMEQLAELNNGRYTDAAIDDADIEFLLAKGATDLEENSVLTEREFDQWHDRGPLIALLLLPLSLLGFRRGWLLLLPFWISFQPQTSYALSWDDLWLRADQQAAKTLEKGDAKAAADQFKNAQWRGAANYQSGNFEQAAKNFSSGDSAESFFNQGNALAKAGKLDDAIAAYQQALEKDPSFEDAQFNKSLVEEIKQQQEEEQQQQSGDQNSDQQESGEQNKSESQSEQPSDQQSGQESAQESEQQDSNQQSENESEQNDSQQSDQNSDNQNTKQNSPDEIEQQSAAEEQEQNKETQQATQSDNESEQERDQRQQLEQASTDPLEQQKQQAMEQWLRKIPDDPSGLLRRKFNYEYRARQQRGETPEDQPQW